MSIKAPKDLIKDPAVSECDKTIEAFNRIKELGYKPYLLRGGISYVSGKPTYHIRVHLKKRYFTYSALSNKWIHADDCSSKGGWYQSSGVDDFVQKALATLDLRSKKEKEAPSEKQITYLKALSETTGIEILPEQLTSRIECSLAIDRMIKERIVIINRKDTSVCPYV